MSFANVTAPSASAAAVIVRKGAPFYRVCVADNLKAVREAARRAVIENLSVLFTDGQARFVRMSPPHAPDRETVVASR